MALLAKRQRQARLVESLLVSHVDGAKSAVTMLSRPVASAAPTSGNVCISRDGTMETRMLSLLGVYFEYWYLC